MGCEGNSDLSSKMPMTENEWKSIFHILPSSCERLFKPWKSHSNFIVKYKRRQNKSSLGSTYID